MTFMTPPTNPYSAEWSAFWAANPHLPRGVGADAAAAAEPAAQAAAPAVVVNGAADADATKAAEPVAAKADDKAAPAAAVAADKNEPAKVVDWRDDLPDDLKETAKRFASKADAMRAIVDLRKRESQVRVPGKNATPEETAAFNKAIGIPEKPELYEFPDLPEGLEINDKVTESRAEWGKRFHTLGVPKEMAKELSKLANEDALREAVAQVQADKEFAAQQEAALRNEWKGDDYELNRTMANRAFSEMAKRSGLNLDDLTKIETKDGRFLFDRTEIVRMFATIGREMSEGAIGPTLTDSQKDTVDEEIRGVRGQITAAQASGDSKRANTLYQKEQALISKREGSKNIVGSKGRSA